MRTLLALALALFAGLASAQTLTPMECSPTRFCYDAAGPGTLLYANDGGAGIVELIDADGTIWMGSGAVGLSIANYALYRQPGGDAVIFVTATWVRWQTKGGSGRGAGYVHNHWALVGGEVVR